MMTELLDWACTTEPWIAEDVFPNEKRPLVLSFGGILPEDETPIDWEKVSQDHVRWHLDVNEERKQRLSHEALSLFEIIKKGLKITSHKRRRALYLRKIPAMLKRHGRVGICYGLVK